MSPGHVPAPKPGDPVLARLAVGGIPAIALDAYRQAAGRTAESDPACGLHWPLLAAIGRVESDHGRFGGAVLHVDGTSTPKIIGIPLDGVRAALIRDSDAGRLDGDTVLDRAVGPMQFIPTTWARYAVDDNGDSVADPFSVYDAALAAAHYLCAAGGDLRTTAGRTRAVLAYNDSDSYLALVLGLEATYAGDVPVPAMPAPVPPSVQPPRFPPVDPGPPLGLQRVPRSSAGASPSQPPASPSATSVAPTASTTPTPSATPASSDTASSTCPTPSASASAAAATTTPATSAADPSVPATTAAAIQSDAAASSATASSVSADATPSTTLSITPSDTPSGCPG
jgi:hypothetical protein